MELTRLEAKDILANVSAGLDPDLRAKLDAFINHSSYQHFIQGPVSLSEVPLREIAHASHETAVERYSEAEQEVLKELAAAKAQRESGPEIMVLTPRWQALGYTQEDVDIINEQRRIAYALDAKLKKRIPIVGEENADNPNADFAQPDGAHGRAPEQVAVGQKNRAGDVCIGHQDDGLAIFECAQRHPYTQSLYLPGCPTCFTSGGATTTATTASAGSSEDDDDRIPGEESF